MTRKMETFGLVRSQGIIDLLYDPTRPGRFDLLYLDGQQGKRGQSLILNAEDGAGDILYYSGSIDPTVQRAINFPTTLGNYRPTAELLGELSGVIKKFSGLAQAEVSLLAYTVLASWFTEFTPVPINVALIGTPSPERRQLLRLLLCLLRRALRISEVSVAAVSSLPMDIAPTLVIERCEPTPQFQRFLDLTNANGSQIVAKGRILRLCCSKVLCSEESWAGVIPGWPELEIVLPQSWQSLPPLNLVEQQRIVEEFQPKLQMCRLQNYTAVRDSVSKVPSVPFAAQETASALVACVAADEGLRAQLTELLKNHFLAPRTFSAPHLALLSGLLAVSHAKKSTVSVGEITTHVNRTLESWGETLVLQARAVGNILRSFDFSTQRLGSTSRGIMLLSATKERIHSLARNYGILENPSEHDCAFCQKWSTELLESI